MGCRSFLVISDVVLNDYKEVPNWQFGEKIGTKHIVSVCARGVDSVPVLIDALDASKFRPDVPGTVTLVSSSFAKSRIPYKKKDGTFGYDDVYGSSEWVFVKFEESVKSEK